MFLFRWIFRDPRVDVRFLVLGAILPDLIDLPLGTIVLADRYSNGELWFHTLLAPTAIVVAVLLLTRRGRRRRAWMALAVGMMFHLLLDGMWTSAETFFWPFFGLSFPAGPQPYWSGVWARALADPMRWISEAIGFLYLVFVWRRSGLGDPTRRRRLLAEGRLEAVS